LRSKVASASFMVCSVVAIQYPPSYVSRSSLLIVSTIGRTGLLFCNFYRSLSDKPAKKRDRDATAGPAIKFIQLEKSANSSE
jgi:hypothetical protein